MYVHAYIHMIYVCNCMLCNVMYVIYDMCDMNMK